MSIIKSRFRINLTSAEAVRNIEKEASPDLKRHFQLIKDGLEQIPGVPREAVYGAVTLRALANKPDIFKNWFLTEYYSVKVGEIPAKIKEAIAYLVSKINEEDECQACTPYHRAAAQYEGASSSDLEILDNYEEEKGRLSKMERTLIDFGIKAAFFPRHVLDEDVQRVKELGITDAGILELVSSALIAYNLSALNQVLNLKEGEN